MAKKPEGGQIEYRKRVKDKDAAAAAAKEAAWRKQNVASPHEVETSSASAPAAAPKKHATTPAAHVHASTSHSKSAKTEKSGKATKAKTRTPSEIRDEAAEMVAQLLEMSDADYNAAMQKLSADDAMLYTAVVDAINNADATADPDTK